MAFDNSSNQLPLLVKSINDLLLLAEQSCLYYYKVDEHGDCSDEIQSNFYEPGIFYTDNFQIKITCRCENPLSLSCTFFNFDVSFDDDDDLFSKEEDSYDTIVIEKNKIVSVKPFNGDSIPCHAAASYPCFNNILYRANSTINDFMGSMGSMQIKSPITKQKTHPF